MCRIFGWLPVSPCQQAQEFTARAGIGFKCTEHRTGRGIGILFFHTAHGHTEMQRIDHYGDALRF